MIINNKNNQILHSSLRKKQRGGSQKIDPGYYRLVRFIWALEWVLLEQISGHVKQVTGKCQCGFTKGKSYLNNLTAAFGKVTGLVGEGRLVEVIVEFRQTFSSVSHNVLMFN